MRRKKKEEEKRKQSFSCYNSHFNYKYIINAIQLILIIEQICFLSNICKQKIIRKKKVVFFFINIKTTIYLYRSQFEIKLDSLSFNNYF